MFLLCPLVLVREGPVYSLSLVIQHQGALAKELVPLEKILLRSYASNLQNNKRFIFSPLGDIFAGPNLTLLITDILNHLHPFGMQNTTVLLHNNDLGLNLNVLRLIVYCKKLKSSHRHLLLVLNFWQTIQYQSWSMLWNERPGWALMKMTYLKKIFTFLWGPAFDQLSLILFLWAGFESGTFQQN